jgi:hypothetical protein
MKIGGKEISNWWLIGGGLGIVAVVVIYRKANSASSASSADSSSATNSSATDPVTGLPYSEDNTVDPLTGMTYLAEAQEYGSVAAAESEVSSGGIGAEDSGEYGGIDSGYPTGWDGSGTSTAPTGTTYATNAQWASAVQAGLVGLGYSQEQVGAALGLFFGQQPLNNSTYVTILQTAEAEYGPPPTGTYSIIPGTGGGGGGTSGQTAGGYQAYAPGGKRLDQLTVPGVSYDDLAKANPDTAKKFSGEPLPKGWGYYVPKEPAPTT